MGKEAARLSPLTPLSRQGYPLQPNYRIQLTYSTEWMKVMNFITLVHGQ